MKVITTLITTNGMIYMRKSVIFILFLSVFFIEFNPSAIATVGITPMTMLAEGYVNESGLCLVEKSIIFVNNDNETVLVELSYKNIEVIFKNDTFNLKPYEKKTIKPIIVVKEGEYTGQILVKTRNSNNTINNTGVNIIPTMAISIKTIGLSIDENNSKNYFENNYIFLILFILFIVILLSAIYLIMRKNKKNKNKT
jgi:hypothetical protein